ncbi:hypothetical protein ILYODFUR_037118 [Ilyodon furcidens]|uniref:Uncharacterized protein n=1 Tax=Ilyodon furcidens TaxID=33524 RepID=A0ABV0SSN2_9TELE
MVKQVLHRMRKRLLRLSSSAHIRITPSVDISMMSLATVEQNLLFRSSTELKQKDFRQCILLHKRDIHYTCK